MTTWTLVVRSLRFHARAHWGTFLGAAIGSTVLIGALVVGDSVRESLRQMAVVRVGRTPLALASHDRLFRDVLAKAFENPLDAIVAPALQLPATANTADDSARANHVQILGVDERFWSLSGRNLAFRAPSTDEIVVNQRLARQLAVKVGDVVLVRVPKPTQLSRDAPISPQEDYSVALRLTLSGIATEDEMGAFSLQANQIPPFNAFVSLAMLQERLKVPGRANLILVGPSQSAVLLVAAGALRNGWELADAELELRELPGSAGVELRTARVFLDEATGRAALQGATAASGLLTYFVNELRLGDRSTPYSMVTAMGAPVVPPDMRDNEILVSPWLADDLQAKPGDELELKYYVVGLGRKLEEKITKFKIRAILPAGGPASDPTLMPDFPGMKDAKNCREWDAGFPIDTGKIREKDQKFWEDFRGTPKAFVTLAAGQAIWGNRFGRLTSVRYPAGAHPETVVRSIKSSLAPEAMGLQFQPVLEQALAASSQSQDFGQLFLGFSFFLIVAALMLMALLFQLGIEQRTNEVGILLALGFTPKQVRRLLLGEGAMLALLGGLIGTIGGVGYARVLLHRLTTVWRDAVGTSALEFHADVRTLVIGAVASTFVAVLTIWLALRKQAQRPAFELLAAGAGMESAPRPRIVRGRNRGFWWGGGAAVLALLVIGLAASAQTGMPGAFFGAGALLLISGLSLVAGSFAVLSGDRFGSRDDRQSGGRWPNLTWLAVRGTARRQKRSLATIGLLACGSFLIAAIGAFQLDAQSDAEKRSSGTGGFALVGESTLPVVQDLNDEAGRSFFGLDAAALGEVKVVPMRVRDGEDASCLNLNRAQKPRLLGVRPEWLDQRKAFTFARVAPGLGKDHPWLLLKRRESDDVVPAIGDQASIQWALGKQVGDIIDYTDEQGRTLKIRLVASVANSVLQGNLLLAEDEFVARFPNEEGYRMFLVDAPSNRLESVASALSRGLRDVGLELTPAARRLAAFNAVQNTYLNTFQVLGGLGLLLGSAGLGVVVLRNVLERRGELALLLAVGFRGRALRWLVMAEHGALLLLGLGIGTLAAAVAVVPALLAPGAGIPFRSLGVTLALVWLSGIIWTWAAAGFALRGRLLEGLRSE